MKITGEKDAPNTPFDVTSKVYKKIKPPQTELAYWAPNFKSSLMPRSTRKTREHKVVTFPECHGDHYSGATCWARSR